MKGSTEFNNILDECLERLLTGETIEQCLQSYPEQATELEPLLRIALAVRKASTIQPRTEFRDRARYQFRSALQEVEPKKSRWLFGWQSRWATVVTVLIILVLLGGGTVTAATNSMPDQPLYPVKLATEQVRLTFTPSALGKAELYANLADKRVTELIYVASKGNSKQVERVTQRLDAHLVKIASLVAPQGIEDSAMLAPESIREVPEELAPAPEAAPERAGKGAQDVQPQSNRRAKLREIVKHYSVNHPARLQAILKTSPESVKPALRQAIKELVTSYERTLKIIGERED